MHDLRRSPLIHIPRHREIQVDTPAPRLKGYVKWELVREGKVIRSSGGFHENLITTKGLNLLGAASFSTMTAAAGVGTGVTAPAITDTDLQAIAGTRVGRSGVVAQGINAISPEYLYFQAQYKFLEANANGNLTEFATFADGTPNFIFSRQLLKDALGAPTVIVKTALDQLWITYELRGYPPIADVVTTVTISGIVYDITIRTTGVAAAGQNQWDGWIFNGPSNPFASFTAESNALVARAGNPSGFREGGGVTAAYVNGNFYLETQKTWELGDSNYATGIGSIYIWDGSGANGLVYGLFQIAFTSVKIPKDATKKLILFVRRHWAAYP